MKNLQTLPIWRYDFNDIVWADDEVAPEALLAAVAPPKRESTDWLRDRSCDVMWFGLPEARAGDAITGLVTRERFEDLLSERSETLAVQAANDSLILVDLDHFQVVNDLHGRQAGDELIAAIIDCMQRALGDDAVMARFDGDEFSILLRNCPPALAETTAESLRQAIEGLPFSWNGQRISVSASVGVVSVAEFRSVQDMLRAADVACTVAKDKGFNRVQRCHSDDAELAQRLDEMGWVQRLHDALAQDRFCLYEQPIQCLDPHRSSEKHVELLLRLIDEHGHLVIPKSFMPSAERYGLMPAIDRWVTTRAIETIGGRTKRHQHFGVTSYAINLSGATVGDAKFIDFASELMTRHEVDPGLICFEITETSAVRNIDAARSFIEAFKAMGCRFSLDDFGTGMSSYAYLKHLPVDAIKIDGSFIREIINSKIDRVMVEMIVRVAGVMSMDVIAECVENDVVLSRLRLMNVGFAQGYAVGLPVEFLVGDQHHLLN